MANVIMISGAGAKSFCAGGDVAALAQQNSTPVGQQESKDYFGLEYQLDHLIATYSKPYIAVLDGITMGGGVGLSVHAPFRIATERTVFAMPETTIGFFPDVGGSFFLPRLDGAIGSYLALTSERLHGVQAYYAGIATHYLDSSVLTNLTTRLSELVFRDHATLPERLKLVNSTIAEFSTGLPSPDSYESSKYGNITGSLRAAIDRCFSERSIEGVISALKLELDGRGQVPGREVPEKDRARIAEWAKQTLKTLEIRSPTSLKVTLRQLQLGKNWSINDTFVREHWIASKFMEHADFVEGVSARLLSKPPKQPTWNPDTLKGVRDKDIDSFFDLPANEDEHLKLLEPHDKSAIENHDYKDYPHAWIALPREEDIQEYEKGRKEGDRSAKKEFEERWESKEGVEDKVTDVLARMRMAGRK